MKIKINTLTTDLFLELYSENRLEKYAIKMV